MPTRLPGSFRDPAGHILVTDGIVYRRIEAAGRDPYDRLMRSGLYDSLVGDGLLVPHEDLGPSPDHPGALTIIRPEQIPMISYPYEWCFSQWRDAALVTLGAQRRALELGMSLKDASAYNVQFLRGRPVLIDTLSFEPYEGGPWIAYRQFCQHFYAPLLLMTVLDGRLGRLARLFIDGIPLDLASRLLPRQSYLKAGPLMHIHLHATAERRLSGPPKGGHYVHKRSVRLQPDEAHKKKRSPLALVESLERSIRALKWKPRSEWTTYYRHQPGYDDAAFARKSDVVARWVERLRPASVWDLGANTGRFSKLAAGQGCVVVALDGDVACVELFYQEIQQQGLKNILPLTVDLANPSPAIGWANEERLTLEERGPADLVMSLALIHHLVIGNNVPLPALAGYFARLARHAILEFVPKSDPMVRDMLSTREDVFSEYSVENFERALTTWFTVDEKVALGPSDRVLYLLTTR